MASEEIIDVAALLEPISDDQPAGVDAREDISPTSKYQALKTARSAARAAERKSIHDGDTSEADEHWRKIASLAPDILRNQSKDLEVACWLAEALVRRNGFNGLRDAFNVIHGLLENYWEHLHPMPDEDGIETRTASVTGLNGEGAEGVLIAPIRKVPLTEGDSPGPFSYWQYQQALEASRGADEDIKASKVEKLGFSFDDIERAVNDSSVTFFVNQLDDITEAIATYKKIGQLLEQHCPSDLVPPTRNIISILEECRGAISHIGKSKFPVAAEPEEIAEATSPGTASAPATSAAQAGAARGPIASRAAALEQLLEVAQFYRKTEPHSPVSYLIEKAVKWGNMPLNELIVELIPDSSSRERFSELTGVKNED